MKKSSQTQPFLLLSKAIKKGKYWLSKIKCFCGKEFYVDEWNFKRRGIKSCGCSLNRDLSFSKTIHGLSHSPEYHAWASLKGRCHNKRNYAYKNYGGRGIKVCERWMVFENFYSDMGKRPFSNYSIDRIDNNGNYEPGNCRWATDIQQTGNKRNIIFVEGVPLKRFCEKNQLNYKRIHRRFFSLGWTLEKALDSKKHHRYDGFKCA